MAETFDAQSPTLDSFKINAPISGSPHSYYEYIMNFSGHTFLDTDIIVAAYIVENGNVTFINKTGDDFEIISYNKALELTK